MLPTCLRRNERRDPCGTGCARRPRGFWLVACGLLWNYLGVGTVGEIALAWLVLALSA